MLFVDLHRDDTVDRVLTVLGTAEMVSIMEKKSAQGVTIETVIVDNAGVIRVNSCKRSVICWAQFVLCSNAVHKLTSHQDSLVYCTDNNTAIAREIELSV